MQRFMKKFVFNSVFVNPIIVDSMKGVCNFSFREKRSFEATFMVVDSFSRFKKVGILLLFIAVASAAFSQNKPVFRIGAEIGGGFIDGDIKEKWDFRQDVSFYDYGGYNRDYYSDMSYLGSDYFYFGIKPQVSFYKDRLNIYSGIRFTMFGSSIGNDNDNSFLYLRIPNPDAVEFYKVAFVKEKTGYLSVPLEVSYHFLRGKIFSQNTTLSLFLKLGGEIGINVFSNQRIDFLSPKMQVYEKDFFNTKPNSLYGTFYMAIGTQLTTRNGMQYSYELLLPGEIISENNFSLMDPTPFVGFQLSVQFPTSLIFKNKQQ